MTEIITRFAPSPTGFLHIGGARTALFNWLYARHHGGRFRLRIEDTDRERSTTEAIGAILDGLAWLGLDWDGEVVYQSTRATHHAEAAQSLLAQDKAYRCYCTPEELAEMRERRMAEGLKTRYDRRWRDRDPSEAPPGVRPVIRFKAPLECETIINDLVQGEVRFDNSEFDDIVLLRSDGTPTYTLAVVVDDHDMGVTTVIRGVDHLTNAFQHTFIFEALGWDAPAFAHVPLIHGPDGARLAKRHGALGVGAYREQGYLPEAMRNYLLRLGWSHGDDEIISTEQALEWFDIDAVGRSPARFDFDKLDSLNGHYLRQADDQRLAGLVAEHYAAAHGRQPDERALARLGKGMQGLKQRAKTISELTENAHIYLAERPLALAPEAAKLVAGEGAARLARLAPAVAAVESWDEETLERAARAFAAHEGVKLGDVAQPLRAALTGSRTSPGIFEVMVVLGRAETLVRIGDVKS
ncbi:MAG: glutamate--tRNA ligase [Alphaproteobacteria bacterium]|nr:glutamate--tRNA ligase [Alphaproteobacteria bacterium]